MAEPLWQWTELLAAAGGRAKGKPTIPITGISIDSRVLVPGDVFVALEDKRDGHEFVTSAFEAGAAAAIVAERFRGPAGRPLLRVPHTLRALEAIGRAARVRSNARIVAVTGSAGKTGTKEMLRRCLAIAGPAHASEKSYNNHWGVPLTLATLPKSAEFGIFEIGMNHAGEITPLAEMVRPHVAVVTTVEPVHLAYFASVQAIAEAKAEILLGLVPGGTAILPRDNAHYELLHGRAASAGARIVSFGLHKEADVRCVQAELGPKGTSVIAGIGSQRYPFRISVPGEHYVKNALAVLATLHALGLDAMKCLAALSRIAAPQGRGARSLLAAPGGQILLIDESYNANPASVRAALAAMATTPRQDFARRIAVLGDMLELGNEAPALHKGLKEAVDAAGVDLVFACGEMMKLMFDELAPVRRGGWAETSAGLTVIVADALQAGDVVMVKGSLGSRMAPVVDAIKARFAAAPDERPGG